MIQLAENTLFHQRYLLTHRLGIGAFSEVWKAKDQRTGTSIAIKVFAPDKGIDQDGIEIFADEYRKTDELVHPHILRANYFDVNGTSPYLVLPYCKGGSLNTWLARKHPFGEKDVVELLAQIASALAYIHQSKDEDGNIIVHQDIKPANILVKDERLGNYLLADFGISSRMKHTVARSVLGSTTNIDSYASFTPAYAPPEVNRSIPSPAGDIFSLGLSLLELIYGKGLPYQQPLGQILDKTGQFPELPPISDRFSDTLCALVLSCLELNKHNRPTASSLAEKADYYLKNGTWQAQYPPTEMISRNTNSKTNPIESEDDTVGISKASLKDLTEEEDTLAIPKLKPMSDNLENGIPVSKLHVIENVKNENDQPDEKPIPPPPQKNKNQQNPPIIEEELEKNTNNNTTSSKSGNVKPSNDKSGQKQPLYEDKTSTNKVQSNGSTPKRSFPKAIIAVIVGIGGFVGAWFGGLIPHGSIAEQANTTIWQQTEVVQDLPEIYRQQLTKFYDGLTPDGKKFHLYSPNDWTLIDFKMGTDSQKSLACILRNKTNDPPSARLLIWHPDAQGNLQLDSEISPISCQECNGIAVQESTIPTVCAVSAEASTSSSPVTMTHSYLRTEEPTPRIIYHTKQGKLGLCYGK